MARLSNVMLGQSSVDQIGKNATGGALSSTRFTIAVVSIELLLVMLTQKIALPVGGDAQVEISVIIHLCVLALLGLTRNLFIDPLRALAYFLTVMIAAVVHVLNGQFSFSLPSMLLYTTLYATFIFIIPMKSSDYRKILNAYSNVSMLVSFLTVMNWIFQFLHIPWPNMDHIVTGSWHFREFAYLQPIYWGASLSKPNAFFFLETSILGQWLALAFVIEAYFFQRIGRIVIFLAATLSTLSGTGMMLILVATPFLLQRVKPSMIVALILAIPVVLAIATPLGLFDQIERRSVEFDRKGSSGDQRFVAPFRLMSEHLEGDTYSIFVGVGAGNISRGFNLTWLAVVKSFFEYGLVFCAAWCVLIGMIYVGNGRPFVLSCALLLQYNILNGAFAVPYFPVLHFIILGGYAILDDTSKTVASGAKVWVRWRNLGARAFVRAAPVKWRMKPGQVG